MADDWTKTDLATVCKDGALQTGPFGSQLHASDYQAEGVPVVMPQDLIDGRISERAIARVAETDAERLSKHRLRNGDIVYSRRGDVTRKALVTAREAGWLCGTGCLLVRPGASADSRWLVSWLSTPWTQAWIVQHAVGATMPNLNTKILGDVPVSLPPMAEQRRIATVLGAFDDLVRENQRRWDQIRTLGGLLYEGLVARAESEQTLGSVARVSQSTTRPGSGSLRYVDIATLGDGELTLPAPIDWDAAPSRARMLASSGSTLWSTVRPNRRAHALLVESPPDLVVSTGIAVIEPSGVGPAEIAAACDRQEFVDHLVSRADGSAYPAVRASDFSSIPIPRLIPSDSRYLEDVMWPLWRDAHAGLGENEGLLRARAELLPLLMNGRVRVADAEGSG